MLWAIAGAKGGVGTSTVATTIAFESARTEPTLLVDLAGDLADIVGVPPAERGTFDWLATEDDVGVEALDRLVVPVTERLELLPAGERDRVIAPPARVGALVNHLRARPGVVVVDIGLARRHPGEWRAAMVAGADRRTLVLRACYLALRRARDLPFEFEDIVEVSEPGRALTTIDIEGVLVRPVTVRVPLDPSVARAVDAGLLMHRPPRRLRRLRQLLDTVPVAS